MAEDSEKVLAQRGEQLFKSKELADCEFHILNDENGDKLKTAKIIQAHKMTLAFASPVFQAMFYNQHFDEAKLAKVEIVDALYSDFYTFLRYIYTRDLKLKSVIEAAHIFYLANKYEVVDLEKLCVKYALDSMSVKTVGCVYEFGRAFEKTGLKEKAITEMENHAKHILLTPHYLDWNLETFVVFVSQNSLNILREATLFTALEKYTTENNLDRSMIEDAVKQIRYLTMTVQEFNQGPIKSGLLTDQEKLAILSSIISPGEPAFPYPEGFTKVRNGRYNYLKYETRDLRDVQDTEILFSIRRAHNQKHLFTYENLSNQTVIGTIADVLFYSKKFSKGRVSMMQELKDKGLAHGYFESRDKYLTRLLSDKKRLDVQQILALYAKESRIYSVFFG